jgi:hypothetical protein
MILLDDVINNGFWLHCEFPVKDQLYKFRLKVLSFQKLNLIEVDEPEKINMWKDTIIWLMEVEIINLSKEPMASGFLSHINIINTKGSKFIRTGDAHLCSHSEFAKKKRLDRFFGPYLNPKIKAIGTLIFRLPVDGEDVYSISIRSGSICEA